ncbi:hypothetical protein [Streptomyces scabiei]|uniref:hypothetical protein n=1 Tax=Streptomyces scabiei TaxID=1930 RepID=UPI000A913AA1|nr:hypothetical protein [Streptomyces scabiei]
MAQPPPELELCEQCEGLVIRPWERTHIEGLTHLDLGDGDGRARILSMHVLTDAPPCPHEPKG